MSVTCKVLIVTTLMVCIVDVIKSTQAKLPPDLRNVLRKYGKHSTNNDIEDTIRAKVAELLPVLDDNKILDIKESTENDSEGVPVTPLRENDSTNRQTNSMNKEYKKLRKEIERSLKMEQVSENTRKSVINSLGRIAADLMNNKCLQKQNEEQQTEVIIKRIQEKWDKLLRKKFHIKPNNQNETVRKAFEILTGLRQFVFDVHEDYKKLESRYTRKCDFIDKNDKQGEIFEGNDQRDECDVPICSGELRFFLKDFYRKLKGANSAILDNVASMHRKNKDLEDLDEYIEALEKIMNSTLMKHFKESMDKIFEIVDANSEVMNRFVMKVTKSISENLEMVEEELDKTIIKSSALRSRVMKDLRTIASIELGNLKNDMKNSICSTFQTCNGEATWRKNYKKGYDRSGDPNNIHIKLKLGFAKKPIETIFNILNARKNSGDSGHEKSERELEGNKLENKSARKSKITYVAYETPFDISIYKNITVTRTTLRDYIDKGTSKMSKP